MSAKEHMNEMVREQHSAAGAARRAVWAVAGAALAAAMVMVLLGFERPGTPAQANDPYHYGEIARGLVENGFDRVTRRAAMLYTHLLAAIYWFGGTNFVAQMFHCAFHTGTAVLVFLLGQRLFNVRTGMLAVFSPRCTRCC